MSRIVSFVVLVAILLVIAGLFFKVMAGFLLPMFLAVLLVIMFGPLHRWFKVKCKGYDRLAAGLTTASILLILLVPLAGILIPAWYEGVALVGSIAPDFSQRAPKTPTDAPQDEPAAAIPDNTRKAGPPDLAALQEWAASELVKLGNRAHLHLASEDIEETIREKTTEWLPVLALGTPQYVGSFLLAVGVMIISLYYFFADGPAMVRTVMRLSPLDDKYEEQLVDKFGDITRAVVIATLLSAFVQGLLAGLGFYLAGLQSVFLLTALAMLLAMVPFVGCAGVWAPACFWLWLGEGRTLAAALLAIYCVAIVSMADNIIKPIILHGRSNLHPLLALLSVIGGVQTLGPIGIFVGPMVVVFLQALLNMLHTELDSIEGTAAK